VVKEGAFGRPGATTDLFDGAPREALFDEDRDRCIEELVPCRQNRAILSKAGCRRNVC
jgi:hypothetical protein